MGLAWALAWRRYVPVYWQRATVGPMEIHLSLERETKNTVRFQEDEKGQPEDHPGADVIGALYVQKFAWAVLGKPERIAVEISVLAAPDEGPGPGT